MGLAVSDGHVVGPVALATDQPPMPVLAAAPGGGDLLLLESGTPDNLLLETGDALLLE